MVLDWISLCLAPGLGLTGFWRLVEHFGSPELVLAVGQTKLLKVPGIQPRQVGALACPEALRRRGSTELELLLKKGCLAVDFGDPAYPELLRQIADPPPVLFVRGRKELLHRSCLAIVGSRASTAYGRRTARSLAADLAPSLTIVSGMALGIDAEAHAGASPPGERRSPSLAAASTLSIPYRTAVSMNRLVSPGCWSLNTPRDDSGGVPLSSKKQDYCRLEPRCPCR